MGQKLSSSNFRQCVILSFLFAFRNSGECNDPISTGTSSRRHRGIKLMKEKVAVSVVVILVLASFCLAEAQQTAKTMPLVGFVSSTGTAESPSPLFEAFRLGFRDLG